MITAPQSSSVNPKEMDEAMRKLKEASSLISGTVDSGEIYGRPIGPQKVGGEEDINV